MSDNLAQLTGVKGLIQAVGGLVNPLIGILVGAALIVFFWGLVKFLYSVGSDDKARETGRRIMVWGLIAIFVILSVWPIIRFFQQALLPGMGTTINFGDDWI